MTRSTLSGLLCLAMLSGCSVSRSDLPAFTSASRKPPAGAAGCIVREADSRSIDTTGIGKTITHHIITRAPGKEFEVHPMQQIVVGEEVYFVRVTGDGSGSKIAVYALRGFQNKLIAAARACE